MGTKDELDKRYSLKKKPRTKKQLDAIAKAKKEFIIFTSDRDISRIYADERAVRLYSWKLKLIKKGSMR